MDETAASRFRTYLAGAAPLWEVGVVVAGAIVVWRLTLGWNWSSIETANPVRTAAPQSDLDWLVLALTVAACVGWLAWRGFPVVGALVIWASIVVLSGWRLAAAGLPGWPISLASLVFVLSALCIVAGSTGAWLRHRSTPPDPSPDHDYGDEYVDDEYAGDTYENTAVATPEPVAADSATR